MVSFNNNENYQTVGLIAGVHPIIATLLYLSSSPAPLSHLTVLDLI
ncbi:MAG TPA: hypothetical protein VE089_03040 [Nitrososphaeraceae archaeon]|nr:hypothetical protein [Nitrososphaeraceae archaeon]